MQLGLVGPTVDSVALSLKQRFEALRVGIALHDPERQFNYGLPSDHAMDVLTLSYIRATQRCVTGLDHTSHLFRGIVCIDHAITIQCRLFEPLRIWPAVVRIAEP